MAAVLLHEARGKRVLCPPGWPAVAVAGHDKYGIQPQAGLIHHHGADGFSFVHQIERIIDAFERQSVGDEIVDGDSALHVPVHDFRNISAAPGAAEGRAFPDAAGDELEGARRDFLTGAGDTDDDADAPALVAALERLT